MDAHRTALVAILALAACRGRGPEPWTALPADADAVAVTRPVRDVAARLKPLLDRFPEAAGAAELLRSLAGIDLADAARTRESGLDPARGIAAAWWKGGLLVVLPVADEGLAGRRLGLRLARLGFAPADGDAADAPVRRFEDASGRVAALRVAGPLAWVCAGGKGACEGLAALAARADATDPTRDAVAELGLPDAVAAGVLHNRALAAAITGAFGKGAANPFVLAMVGDVRWALDLDGGSRVRAAAGAVRDPVPAPAAPASLPERVAALVAVGMPAGLATGPVASALATACGGACDVATAAGAPAAGAVAAAWTGIAGAALLAEATVPAGPLPLDLSALGRLHAVAGARFARGAAAGDAARLIAAALRASGWNVPADAGPATAAPQASVSVSGDAVFLATGEGSADRARTLAGGEAAGLAAALLAVAEPRVLRVDVDPGALLRTFGNPGIEFLGHLLGGLRRVSLTADWNDGRALVDVAVVLR